MAVCSVTFHGHRFKTQRIGQLSAHQISWILWELYKNQFRLELLALDYVILKHKFWTST
jgi:hypothetical protein